MARVLVVDDSLMMRKTIRLIMERAGHQVVAEAENGERAWVEYQLHLPDVVLLDLVMPEMDGNAALQKIMGSYPDAKVIVVSSHGTRQKILDAMRNGAKYFIVKPVTTDKVLEVMRRVLYGEVNPNMGDQMLISLGSDMSESVMISIEDDIRFRLNAGGRRIIFHFGQTEEIDAMSEMRIGRLFDIAVDGGAQVQIVSASEDFVNRMKAKENFIGTWIQHLQYVSA